VGLQDLYRLPPAYVPAKLVHEAAGSLTLCSPAK
jgi:hypothetical protein